MEIKLDGLKINVPYKVGDIFVNPTGGVVMCIKQILPDIVFSIDKNNLISVSFETYQYDFAAINVNDSNRREHHMSLRSEMLDRYIRSGQWIKMDGATLEESILAYAGFSS